MDVTSNGADAAEKYTIAVVGMGYVGMSVAALLARRHHVTAVDTRPERVDAVNAGRSTVQDTDIEEALRSGQLDLTATLDAAAAYAGADFVIVAVPTDYDDTLEIFDTSIVEEIIRDVTRCNPDAVIVIKSTVPVGYTAAVRGRLGNRRLLFSPEFIRESRALYDNLYPSRIVVGVDLHDPELTAAAHIFAGLMLEGAARKDVQTLVMGLTEAEAVKLFSNTYLALRIAYFNELDTYAEIKGLDTRQIIQGVCLDPRIGAHYNNPSFGYGGYCLPKDTKQLLTDYCNVPQDLIQAVVESNRVRKDFISAQVAALAGRIAEARGGNVTVGIYRLTMKANSDNFRQSSIHSIIRKLIEENIRAIIYEPILKEEPVFCGFPVVNNLDAFKANSNLIIANRCDGSLDDVREKVYTRDVFQRD